MLVVEYFLLPLESARLTNQTATPDNPSRQHTAAFPKLWAALPCHVLKNEYLFSMMNISGYKCNSYPFPNMD